MLERTRVQRRNRRPTQQHYIAALDPWTGAQLRRMQRDLLVDQYRGTSSRANRRRWRAAVVWRVR